MAELETIGARAAELGTQSDTADFDVGWTTDDLVWTQDDDFGLLAELEPALRVHRG